MRRPFVLLLVLAFATAAARAAEQPTGWWLDQSKRAGILIAPCGARLCGSIRWLRQPLDPKTGKPRLDDHDPDRARRGDPLCGLTILWNFVPGESPGQWEEGRVYDPETGNTYHARLRLLPDGRLSLRGYILLPLFGRSEIWARPSRPLAPCTGR